MTILSNTLADRELNTSHNTRWPSPHHNFVPEYQQSGIPFAKSETFAISGNKTQVSFPSVTRWIAFSSEQACYINFNDDPDLWTDNSLAFYVPAGASIRFELKCKTLNIKATHNNQVVYILAGLTNISPNNFPNQTYLNGFSVEPVPE